MRTEQKVFIDNLFGNPFAYLLNFLVRIFGFILHIDHSLDKPFKTIVVSKYLGMGSIIQATPLLQTLKENYPGAKIIFITNPSNKILLQHIPSVDEVLTVDDKSIFTLFISVIRLLLDLWKLKPGVFIDLEIYSNFSILITTFSLATNRFGFYKTEKKYKMGLFTHMMFFNQKSPLSETYLQFARLLGCKKIVLTLDKINITETERNDSEKLFLQQNIIKGKYMVINPNASDLRLERRWPAKNYIGLIEMIKNQFPDFKILLIGSKEEANYVGSISLLFKEEKVLDTSGKLSLVNLLWLIKNAALFITNDTGPMHIGFSQETKMVALFGPCAPVQYGQPGNSHLIYKNVYCSPCVHDFLIPPCKGNNQCMKLITPEEVWEAVKLFQTTLPHTIPSENIIYESEFILGQVLRT
jgi:ADP-heptose:LPS heptosyltransferase